VLIGICLAVAFCWFILVSIRNSLDGQSERKASAARQVREQTERDRQAAIRAKLEEGRARAKLAFPNYLDADEANDLFSDDEKHSIYMFDEILEQIDAAETLLRIDPGLASDAEREILNSAPRRIDKEPVLDLGPPQRIIDCGDAGEIYLFSSDQVQLARSEAGVDVFTGRLRKLEDANDTAGQIIRRHELIEQIRKKEEKDRKDALTTGLDELPPIPRLRR